MRFYLRKLLAALQSHTINYYLWCVIGGWKLANCVASAIRPLLPDMDLLSLSVVQELMNQAELATSVWDTDGSKYLTPMSIFMTKSPKIMTTAIKISKTRGRVARRADGCNLCCNRD